MESLRKKLKLNKELYNDEAYCLYFDKQVWL